jgi:hypothetical protein
VYFKEQQAVDIIASIKKKKKETDWDIASRDYVVLTTHMLHLFSGGLFAKYKGHYGFVGQPDEPRGEAWTRRMLAWE